MKLLQMFWLSLNNSISLTKFEVSAFGKTYLTYIFAHSTLNGKLRLSALSGISVLNWVSLLFFILFQHASFQLFSRIIFASYEPFSGMKKKQKKLYINIKWRCDDHKVIPMTCFHPGSVLQLREEDICLHDLRLDSPKLTRSAAFQAALQISECDIFSGVCQNQVHR